MKSVAGLGLGVIALTTGAFITASAAAGSGTTISSLAKGSYFEARVGGDVRAMPAGAVAFGVVGDSAAGMAAFTITMTSDGSSGVILFTNLDGQVPAPGRYEIGDAATSGFRASYVAGSEERPEGLFRARHGVLEITASSAEHISGQFSFSAEGFMASDASDEDAKVTVKGAFTSTRAMAVVREAQP
jgi:hypothetical protein